MRDLLRTGGGRLQAGIASGISGATFGIFWHKLSVPFALSVVVGYAVLLVICSAMRKYNRARGVLTAESEVEHV
jgi:hypothetical protein